MFIASHNKNPLIDFKRKGLKQQKPQIFIGSKFSQYAWQKCMKEENKWKRKGIKVLPALKDKNLAKDSEENDKNLLWPLDQSKRERIVFEKFWKSDEHVKLKVFKKLSMRFSIDRKLGLIDRKCLRLIQQRSSTDRNTQNQTKIFNRNFDRSRNRFDRSKKIFFEKQSNFMQKLLKA